MILTNSSFYRDMIKLYWTQQVLLICPKSYGLNIALWICNLSWSGMKSHQTGIWWQSFSPWLQTGPRCFACPPPSFFKWFISSQAQVACWGRDLGCPAGVHNLTLLLFQFWHQERLFVEQLVELGGLAKEPCFFYYVSVLRKTNKATVYRQPGIQRSGQPKLWEIYLFSVLKNIVKAGCGGACL